ncbi:phosphoribosyltransferase [Methanoculleus sp. FWC-SCC1]|uniref:Phosphoribosyltransferase n=1 Tax=Methanoculleus frigidifontis TaxID=2584085 RepID=A0ABT8M6X4_9EURY|nr:phosphoribosyltransferase [Methanoculleus sp. FWC-SCC1]MDN7023685.1 phosphoribosyltransferase [Methanoculleus sp. FWC-SCC1]
MIPETFTCDLVSWDRAVRLSRALAATVRDAGYRPEMVIAIGRGGYVPARIVCDSLLLNDLTGIKIEHWGIAASKGKEASIRYPLAANVRDLDVLIVDDVTDTGLTLRLAAGYVEGFGPREVRTGVLQHKGTSSFSPDYYVEYITDWRWVIYPWAMHEDLVGFTGKVLTEQAKSLAEIRTELSRRYAIAADEEEIMAALADLLTLGRAVEEGSHYRRRETTENQSSFHR